MPPNAYFQKFTTNGFNPNPTAPFDTEFTRLAAHMGWPSLGPAYNRHHTKALACSQQHPAVPTVVPNAYFRKFAANGFECDPAAAFDDEFERLAEFMGWLSLGGAWNRQLGKALALERSTTATIAPSAVVQTYFSRYVDRGFVPDARASFKDEFARLAGLMGWEVDSLVYGRNRLLAIQAEFDGNYGSCDRLEGWRGLCRDVGVVGVPGSIKQCKKELAKVHINLVDFVDWRRRPEPRAPFDGQKGSLKELREYTKKHKKVFPKVLAKKEGFIKALLRRIF
ncbi:hypothetical protein EG327_003150 [Venturia inaequalis]|uniref:Uncharacterized protein n=1 Tax=Venturia inaequalis TaxID=5025 RepID=A0A8H3VK96_VENIN|nr:hypothetical protein EG327_003150 [Venturia inaequalis]